MSTTLLPRGTTDRVIEHLFPKPSPYRYDPEKWARERRGATLTKAQVRIACSVRDHRYTAVKSCHGIGKSYTAGGVVIPWWMDIHPAGAARVVSTAPSQTQVEAILWNEIGQAHSEADIKGRITHGQVPMWKIGTQICGFGRKPQDLANEDQARQAFQGIHADFVLVVLDEACGIPRWLWEAIDALVTNDECRVLAIGNPDDPTSYFEEVCRPGSGWNVITESAFDSPNFTDEDVPESVKSKLVSRVWVEERKKRWGEQSPLYFSKVLGEFPVDSDDGVIPASWAMRCRTSPRISGDTTPRVAGLDCGAGGDESVMTMRIGNKLTPVFNDRVADTMATADKAHMAMIELKLDVVNVDSIGIGKGIADAMKRLSRGRYQVVEANVSEASTEPGRFHRMRDELWWMGREWSEDGVWDLSDMSDDFIAQLTAPKYKISLGRIKIEGKDETKKRLGSSPDHADSGLLTIYQGKPKQRWRIV